MDDADKDLIRNRVSIVDLVSRYTSLRRSGNRFKALCPFHTERTPSFHVDPDRGLWHCYGSCSTGGDIFAFLMKAEGIGFREALERLAEESGVVLARNGRSVEEVQRERDEKSRLLEANAVADRYFRATLQTDRAALQYVAERGIDHAARETFHIGYAPDAWDSLAQHLRQQRIAADDAETAGLIQPSRRSGDWTDRFRDRLIFPIHDTQERVVAFGGRLIAPRENAPKYLNSPETPLFSKSRVLYALPWARKAIAAAEQVVVVEGYMDAVAAHQSGIQNVVATLGTSLTKDHVLTLSRYSRNIVLSFDADDAGVKAALRAAETIRTAGDDFNLRILTLPPGDDPDSILRRGAVSEFRKAISNARSLAEFRIEALRRRYDLNNDQGKGEFLREAVGLVAQLASPLEEDNLLRSLVPYHPFYSRGGGRAESALRAEVDRLRRNVPQYDSRGGENSIRQTYPRQSFRRPEKMPWNRSSKDESQGRWALRERPEELSAWASAPVLLDATTRAERTVLRGLAGPETRSFAIQLAAKSEITDLFENELHRELALTLLAAPMQGIPTLDKPELAALFTELSVGGLDDEPLDETTMTDCYDYLVRNRRERKARQIMERGQEHDAELGPDDLQNWYRLLRERKGQSSN